MLKSPLKIALLICLIGIIWITLSDYFLTMIIDFTKLQELIELQTLIGLIYVFISSILLYVLIKKYYRSLTSRVTELIELNHKLEKQAKVIENSDLEIQQSEQKFNDLFNISPIPMWVFDSEKLKFLAVNKAAVEHYGYSKDEFLKMSLADIRPVEDLDVLKRVFEKLNKDKNSLMQGVYRHCKKNGEVINVDIRSSRFIYHNEDARIAIINDITELLKVQENLKKSYNSIAHIEEEERERISHDLHDGISQYLVAIKHFSSMITEDNSTDSISKISKTINESAEEAMKECKRLIHDLWPKELYDRKLTELIISNCEKYNKGGKLNINYKIDKEINKILNEQMMFHVYRIFQENMNNTLKHSQATEAQLELIIQNDKLIFKFSDNGSGIDEKTLEEKSSFLSIKRRIAILNGKLEVQNIPDSGAYFQCEIPLELGIRN